MGRTGHRELLRTIRRHLDLEGTTETANELIHALRHVRTRGYLTLGELKAVCRWKAVRAIRHIENNSVWRVRSVTQQSLSESDEGLRLELLCTLHGVSVPMASAILMATDPAQYGVIDIRAWQVLHQTGAVASNRSGVGFTLAQWLDYLRIIRELSAELDTTPRAIDLALYRASKDQQQGVLYRRLG